MYANKTQHHTSYANSLTESWDELKEINKKVAVAIANKMLTVAYALLKTATIYHGYNNYEYLERKVKTNKKTAT